MYKMRKVPELENLVTFIQNKKLSIYNWFYYKEGYSRDFVFHFLDEFEAKPGDKVLDPFMGSGTTLLACKERGVDCIGGDIMPLQIFASNVKTRDYDIEALEKYRKELIEYPFERPKVEASSFIKKYFEKHVLEDIIFFKRLISEIKEDEIREFFQLALMNIAYKNSWIYKDGAVLKVRKRPIAPFRKAFAKGTLRMIKDLKRLETKECIIEPRQMDARKLDLEDESIDFIITSPPYLNKTEYSQIYDLENGLFFDGELKREFNLIGEDRKYEDPFPEQELPGDSKQYFYDMQMVLREMYRVLKKDGKAAINVAGAVFDEGVVESDLFLAKLAEREGFTIKEIIEARSRPAVRNRTVKVGTVRESVIILEK